MYVCMYAYAKCAYKEKKVYETSPVRLPSLIVVEEVSSVNISISRYC